MKKRIPLFIVLIIAVILSMPAWAENEEVAHTVKKGDTLWDISNMYLKTPWKWPLVWANNQDITNPHKIYPGDIVILTNKDGKVEIKIIPAGSKEQRILSVAQFTGQKDKSIVVSPNFASLIYSPAPMKGKGSVIQKEDIGILASKDDIIFIRMDSASTAKNLSIVTKVTDIQKDGQTIGYLYKVAGLASVLENQNGLIKAKITRSLQEINMGDIVRDDLAVKPLALQVNQLKDQADGQIVDLYAGDNVGVVTMDLVFVDMGKNQGMQQGTLINIKKTIEITGGGSMSQYQGMALVLQPLEKSSMALVVDAVAPILKGYRVSTK